MKRVYNISIDHIGQLADQLAQQLRGGEILALIGPLGAGKTTFTKILGKKLGVKNTITSPTFTILHTFTGKLKNDKIIFHHLDLYRTQGIKEVWALGLKDLWKQPDSITVIEWADKIIPYLPPKTIRIYFKSNTLGT